MISDGITIVSKHQPVDVPLPYWFRSNMASIVRLHRVCPNLDEDLQPLQPVTVVLEEVLQLPDVLQQVGLRWRVPRGMLGQLPRTLRHACRVLHQHLRVLGRDPGTRDCGGGEGRALEGRAGRGRGEDRETLHGKKGKEYRTHSQRWNKPKALFFVRRHGSSVEQRAARRPTLQCIRFVFIGWLLLPGSCLRQRFWTWYLEPSEDALTRSTAGGQLCNFSRMCFIGSTFNHWGQQCKFDNMGFGVCLHSEERGSTVPSSASHWSRCISQTKQTFQMSLLLRCPQALHIHATSHLRYISQLILANTYILD